MRLPSCNLLSNYVQQPFLWLQPPHPLPGHAWSKKQDRYGTLQNKYVLLPLPLRHA